MAEGTVKFFNRLKNYGFIDGDDGKSYFVHTSALNGAMVNEGDRVSFNAVEGDKGPKAEEVKKLEGEQKQEEKVEEKPEESGDEESEDESEPEESEKESTEEESEEQE